MLAPAIPKIEAPLIEVFSSIQGEGISVGVRQAFIRFADCNLDCNYCDTPFQAGPTFKVESSPGSKKFLLYENPADLNDISRIIADWQASCNNVHQSVVLTGGEPLLHADSLKIWLPDLLPILPVYLETNGTLPDKLGEILPWVDMISMDIKGRSTSGTDTPWSLHADFLALGIEKLCQVKFVIDESTQTAEILQVGDFMNRHAPDCPLILQPLTMKTGVALDGERLLKLQEIVAQRHHDVRVIPQVHPWLDLN